MYVIRLNRVSRNITVQNIRKTIKLTQVRRKMVLTQTGRVGPQGETGPTGATGATGAKGDKGDTGVGVAPGGTIGQVLAKNSNIDYDTEWVDQSGGGGAVDSVNGETGTVVLDTDDVADTATNRYTDDTAIARLANTSGTNTGDQDLTPYFNKGTDDTDDITVGTTNKFATASEKTKLGYISVTQAVDLDTMESDIANKQPLDADLTALAAAGNSGVLTATTASFTTADETKLDGIEAGAEVNNISDANATDLTDGGVTTLHSHTVTKSDVGLGNVDNTSNATERAAVAALTNKRITKRVTSITSSATPTINTDDCDWVDITALATAITDMSTNLSGTPTNKQSLVFEIKDDGTPRALAWGSAFVAGGAALPTTTVANKILTVGFFYSTANSLNKWRCIASALEA